MSFRDNLQHLRATRNMTQMQLAMLLGVSRQSVSKWEAERAYPEMDKLLKLCSLFDCTLDDLIVGDLTTRPTDTASVMPAMIPQDVTGYDQVMRSFAWRCALSVSIPLLIVAISNQFLLSDWIAVPDRENRGWMPIWIGAVIGFMILLSALFKRHGFCAEHPSVEDFYSIEEKRRARSDLLASLITGISLLAVGTMAAVLLQRTRALGMSVSLIVLAPGLFLIIWGPLMASRCDLARYNDKSLSRLSFAQIDGIDDEEQRMRAHCRRRERTWCAVIMWLATALALPLMADGDLGARPFFWLPFAVGGALCAALRAYMSLQSGG